MRPARSGSPSRESERRNASSRRAPAAASCRKRSQALAGSAPALRSSAARRARGAPGPRPRARPAAPSAASASSPGRARARAPSSPAAARRRPRRTPRRPPRSGGRSRRRPRPCRARGAARAAARGRGRAAPGTPVADQPLDGLRRARARRSSVPSSPQHRGEPLEAVAAGRDRLVDVARPAPRSDTSARSPRRARRRRPSAPAAPPGRRPRAARSTSQRASAPVTSRAIRKARTTSADVGAALGHQLRDERRPERVDDRVGVDHADQLACAAGARRAGARSARRRRAGSTRAGRARATARSTKSRRSSARATQPLGVGDQDRQLRAAPCPRPERRRSAISSLRRQVLRGAVEDPALLEQRHQVLVGEQPRGRAVDLLGDDLRLQERVVEHVLDDVLGDRLRAARRAPARVSSPRRSARPSRIFRLTSWSEQSTPAELSMKSALIAPAAGRVLDARAAREAEVAALPHDPGAQLVARRRGSRRWSGRRRRRRSRSRP